MCKFNLVGGGTLCIPLNRIWCITTEYYGNRLGSSSKRKKHLYVNGYKVNHSRGEINDIINRAMDVVGITEFNCWDRAVIEGTKVRK